MSLGHLWSYHYNLDITFVWQSQLIFLSNVQFIFDNLSALYSNWIWHKVMINVGITTHKFSVVGNILNLTLYILKEISSTGASYVLVINGCYEIETIMSQIFTIALMLDLFLMLYKLSKIV